MVERGTHTTDSSMFQGFDISDVIGSEMKKMVVASLKRSWQHSEHIQQGLSTEAIWLKNKKGGVSEIILWTFQ